MNNIVKTLLIISLLVSSFSGFSPVSSQSSGYSIEILPSFSIATQEDIPRIVDLASRNNVNTIFLHVKRGTGTNPSPGVVFYNSRIAPTFYNFDVLSLMVEEAHEKNMKIYAVVPVFYDVIAANRGFASEGPQSDGWVCPQTGFNYEKSIIDEITNGYKVDGIVLEYFGYPNNLNCQCPDCIKEFARRYGVSADRLNLETEKQNNSELWIKWNIFRADELAKRLGILSQDIRNNKKMKLGIIIPPTTYRDYFENTDFGIDVKKIGDYVDLLIFRRQGLPLEYVPDATNGYSLQYDGEIYVTVENKDIGLLNLVYSGSQYTSGIIYFQREPWTDKSFSRITKSRAESTNIWAIRVDSREYFNIDLDSYIPVWKNSNINTVIISAGRPYWINFRWPGHEKEYSSLVQLSTGDPLERMISKLKSEGFRVVVSFSLNSPEYIQANPSSAALDYVFSRSSSKVSMVEISQGDYGKYYIDTVEHIVKNYDVDAILVTNGDFYEYSFDSKSEAEYLKYMNSRGIVAYEWPKRNLIVNIDDSTITNWQNFEMEKFYSALKNRVVNYEVELWVSARTDEKDPNNLSRKYGQDLNMLNNYATRVVVTAPLTEDIAGKNRNLADNLRESGISYVLEVPLIRGSVTPVTKEEVEIIMQNSIDGGTKYTLISSNYLLNEDMWDSVLKLSLYKEISGIDDAQLLNLYNSGQYEFLKTRVQEIKQIKEEEITNLRNQSKTKIRNLDKLVQGIDSKYTLTTNLGFDSSEVIDKLDFGKREYGIAKNSFIEGRYKEALERSDNAEIVLGQVNYALQIEIDKVYSSRMFIGFTVIIVFVIFMFLIYYSNRK
ncbi:MAG: hypothetical protein APG12_00759 [Candidatus Methanofastidiosum methylothiophilum]|uniref:Glycosyl hydrolase-like 10 domain-containing protein n=1 Tax=Candidatus Methanofastidiosum methylothiophilum TaxID=1705564 RepID=A0A150IRT8_9EURY|nr:MAG: hypothetical protein APG10_00702 [Candidatus Methanofastidiosum methylthiophilus]KYC47751.1 MAG: hypothetical protein APG11_00920 [Candidatus Methanofastidiosum methylthiophilus]KYC50522.1 MAG: hypothetical protein APG12_00759 [Candidatus Methanofastidiosum methylthiophilus]